MPVRSDLTAALIGMLLLAGCGGGGSSINSSGGGTPAGPNVQPVIVDSGPSMVASSNTPAVNTLYTSVTVCAPGTSTCQTIDHVQVDTGSSGLRILASVLTLGLPLQTTSSGAAIAECVQFVDGSSWGPLRLADIQIAGETAHNLAVQVIGDPVYSIPSACASAGTTEDTVSAFGANGILGVGPFLQDCGSGCEQAGGGIYYTCTNANPACVDTGMSLAQQITNPVSAFAADNNGVLIELDAVSGTAASVSGSLIFGINTQGNNALANATVIRLDSVGSLSTTYKNGALAQSFIDSGSNAYYFPDSSIALCKVNTSFYCPASTLNLSATIASFDQSTRVAVNFSVANADNLFNTNAIIAAATGLAGSSRSVSTTPGSTFNGADSFDWGLPFYFGRTVYTAIENQNTGSGGAGPYFAF